MTGDNKNLILAVVLSAIILLGWQLLVVKPREEGRQQQQALTAQQEPVAQDAGTDNTTQPTASSDLLEPGSGGGADLPVDEGAGAGMTREQALALSERVKIETPRLAGSIALTGAIVDNIILRDYHETTDPLSLNIQLFHPAGSKNAYYAKFGWSKKKGVAVPQSDTVWTADRDILTPDTPVTLSWDNGEGLLFEQIFTVDKDFMISVTQRVTSHAGEAVSLQPYGLVRRFGTPATRGYYILHEGLLGVFDDKLTELKYSKVEEEPLDIQAHNGWLGITDKYWLAAVIPAQNEPIDANFKMGEKDGVKIYQADFQGPAIDIPAGGSNEYAGRLFAGAKELALLDRYADEDNVPNFDLAVDFGWFYFLTKPMRVTLDVLFSWWGNFGLAILTLTLIVKAFLFPIANKSYRSMAKMKLLAPKMKELKERFGDDRMRLNQEMMELYKREKVNPAAGCLPIIPQMIIFFSLYKVLFVSIEMRHAPFFGWIHDLSAPDPLGLLTVFGLVHWQVPQYLAMFNIGIWPILMGISMFLMQKMNPPPPDPMQARIMSMLPLIFTFFLARFPAGLVIYWTWNNSLSIVQQYVIMKQTRKLQK